LQTISFERYEHKYFLPASQAEAVRRFVAPYVRPDAHTNGRYRVSNIYLDTPDLEFYREHRRGALDRFKLRIRAYDIARADRVFLEVKRKIKNVIVKNRVEVSRDRCARVLDEADLPFEEFRDRSILHGVGPVLLLEYDREAFESVFDDESRITFDRAIRYQPAEGTTFDADPAGWTHVDGARAMGGVSSAVLVELKFNTTCPVWMVDLVRTFNLERQAFSKYLAAMDHLLDFRSVDSGWERASVLG
jgi:SPX domain protein involved in polyphosphate accumulation